MVDSSEAEKSTRIFIMYKIFIMIYCIIDRVVLVILSIFIRNM